MGLKAIWYMTLNENHIPEVHVQCSFHSLCAEKTAFHKLHQMRIQLNSTNRNYQAIKLILFHDK